MKCYFRAVQRGKILDAKKHAVVGRDEQAVIGQATDVFLAIKHKRGVAPVGLDLPHAGRGECGDTDEAPNAGHELAQRQLLADQGARGRIK